MKSAYPTSGMVSLVVPAYNEEKRLGANLPRMLKYFEDLGRPFELVVVDDGSTDATAQIVEDASRSCAGIRLLRHEKNMGKGHAVRTGMLEAAGDYVIFTDADLSTPIDTADEFLKYLSNGSDVVVGNRRMRESNLETRQPWHREFLGRIFTRMTRFLLRSPVSDQTCGFKGFKRRAAAEVFGRQRVFDWAFDAEILYIAARRGFRVKQLPVTWRDEPGSKVRVIAACARSFFSLLVIWRNGITGRYNGT